MTTSHDLLVFGATGKTGRHLVRLAHARGLRVAALVRDGRDASAIEPYVSTVLRGDALDEEDCRRAVAAATAGAVVSLLGGRNAAGVRVDATGNIHAINSTRAAQEDARFLLLTSMGCDEQFALMPPQVQQLLGEALLAKTEAERVLRASRLRWTILRPGGLNDEAGKGRYQLSSAPQGGASNYLPREDVALAVLDALADPASIGAVHTVSAAAP